MPAVAMCTCSKKYKMKATDITSSKYHITEHKNGICIYCQHYVHWRHHTKVSDSIEEFTRCDSREVGAGALDLTKDEAYIYGHKIARSESITFD